MKVFISWSGEKSRMVAKGLCESVFLSSQVIWPWMSSEDIDLGARWADDLARNLDDTNAGVLCLTKANLAAPWIIFEAGALSKSVERGCVIPYLIDVGFDELPAPLQQFQSVRADKDGTRRLLHRIFELHPENRRPPQFLDRLFSFIWPEMEQVLQEANKSVGPPNPPIQPTGSAGG